MIWGAQNGPIWARRAKRLVSILLGPAALKGAKIEVSFWL